MDPDLLPFFPPELEREMFETAVYQHPQTVPSLLLVCRRAHDWIERIKYRTVTPAGRRSTCRVSVLQKGIQSNSKPTSFFHDCVRHVYIRLVHEDEAREIISVYRGVQFLWFGHYAMASIFPLLAVLRPERLGIALEPLLVDMDLCRPMFTLVTRLDTLDYIPFVTEDHIFLWPSVLALLPALTHLAMRDKARNGLIVERNILASCKKLEALLLLDGFITEGQPSVDDERFIYMAIRGYEDDWIIGVQGGMDCWARADAFIAKKRRGKFEPSLFDTQAPH
ncbi:hypothetical protein B0H19DRAFT_1068130 [Mycena capillaripes]|nr:hypothetical protein B0H19DRAFT_1068130 [Mycena capillaripes]